jgi:hypothetical protein
LKTFDKEIRRFGISFPQMGALIALSNHEGVSRKELSALLETDVTTAMVVCDFYLFLIRVHALEAALRDARHTCIHFLFSCLSFLDSWFPYFSFSPSASYP